MMGGAEGFCIDSGLEIRPGSLTCFGGFRAAFDSCSPAPYDARAMPNPLLDRSSPAALAERSQVVEKQVKLQTFSGLSEVLAADLSSLAAEEIPEEWRQTPVAIRLQFGWADRGRRFPALEGRVVARVPAVCQRCLGPMQLTLDEELKLLLAGASDAPSAETATGDYDLWEIDEATIRPLDILEEALIMAIPLSPLHGRGEGCDALGDADSADSDETIRPFAGLRSTMTDPGDGSDS
jgi:uncharacterized protein